MLRVSLTGELGPPADMVEVLGQPLPQLQRALLELRKGIGVLLQGNGLLTDLPAAENVALPLRTHTKLPRPVIERLVALKLHAVGLRTAGALYPRELSGGMARRDRKSDVSVKRVSVRVDIGVRRIIKKKK